MHYSQMIRFDNAEEASFSKLSISGIELMFEDANDSLCKLVTTARLSKLVIRRKSDTFDGFKEQSKSSASQA
ncbi:hypothetical protein Tco_0932473 [Tanacetum coccineum]